MGVTALGKPEAGTQGPEVQGQRGAPGGWGKEGEARSRHSGLGFQKDAGYARENHPEWRQEEGQRAEVTRR